MTELLKQNWLTILVVLYLMGMMLYGHYRGFFKIAVSTIALVITIALVSVALPYVSSFIKTNTGVESVVKGVIIKDIGLDVTESDSTTSREGQTETISGLKLPNEAKEMLIKYNTGEIWQTLGVEGFTDYVASYLSNTVFNVIGFVLLFIIIWVLLHIAINFADLFTRLPVIHGLNQIAGAIIGLMEGLVFVWIGCMVISAFAGSTFGSSIYSLVASSEWLLFLFNHNLFSFFLRNIIYSLF